MNVTRENVGDLELLIKIEVTESDYADKVSEKLKEYKRKAQVPGFRKGMAPMGLIQRMYRTAIVADEVQALMSDALFNYIDTEKLEIMASPLSNDEKTGTVDFENSKDFTFWFDAALSPKFELPWNKVDASLYQVKVTPKEIDKQVEEICQRYGKFETPETVGETDYVYGKAEELDAEGNVKEGGVSTFVSFALTTLKNQEEIVPLFVGKKAEETVVFNSSKAFSASDIEKHLKLDAAAAKKFKADLKFTLSGCSRITPHEVNEELFQQVFPSDDLKDVAAFRKRLSKDMEDSYNEQAQILYVNNVRQQMLDNIDITFPEAFLKRWFLRRGDNDITPEQIEADWNEKYIPAMKWELLEGKLEDIKKLEPSHDEIIAEIKDILRRNEPASEEDKEAAEDRLTQAANSIAQDRKNIQQIVDKLFSRNCFNLFNEQLKPAAEKITIKEFLDKLK